MNAHAFNDFLTATFIESLSVLDTSISFNDYVPIDLSSKNIALEQIDVSSSKALEKYIDAYLQKNNAKVAFGGYLEKRNIYSRSSYFKQSNAENERNIHLGVDLWSKADTKVLAVLDGEVHSFQNNTTFGDYGPTIILKHSMNNVEFYSLYGHLSLASIENLKVGANVKQGETIGYLGDSVVNGDYAPHLHFQLIKDMQDILGDYPGVSSKKKLEFYSNNCPDPNLLLKVF